MSQSYLFYNYKGQLLIGGSTVVNATMNYVPPNAFNVNSITFNAASVTPSTTGLNGSSAFINANNNAATHNVYAFGATSDIGTYTINYTAGSPTTINILAVGGGGTCAFNNGGGGGGGGVVMQQVTLPAGISTIIVSVGAGALAPVSGSSTVNGNNTTVTFTALSVTYNITAIGGGCGGSSVVKPTIGGSGGGSGPFSAPFYGADANNNAAKINSINYANRGAGYVNAPGGGGGAGGAGISTSTSLSGGPGIQCTLPGITDFQPSFYSGLGTFGTLYWGGGGGGGNAGTSPNIGGNGGLGGGGGGGKSQNGTAGAGGGSSITTGSNGIVSAGSTGGSGGNGGAFTGGGGGGAPNNSSGGSGGSGIVVIAFPISAGVSILTSYPLNTDAALISYYTFESSSLSTILNSAPGKGTYDATTTLVASTMISSSVYAVGSNSIYLSNGGNNTISLPSLTIGSAGFSISFWFYQTSSNANPVVVQLNSYQSSTNSIMIWLNNGGSNITLNFATNSNVYNVTLSTNTWYHLAITSDSSPVYSGGGLAVNIYLNGSLVTFNVKNITTYPFNNTSFTGSFIGKSDYGYYFIGYLDDFRIYNRLLTGAEVAFLYYNYK
jgi:hypothetical protein